MTMGLQRRDGHFPRREPVMSTRDADESLSILPTALDDISLVVGEVTLKGRHTVAWAIQPPTSKRSAFPRRGR
jgi:hypothetical protein